MPAAPDPASALLHRILDAKPGHARHLVAAASPEDCHEAVEPLAQHILGLLRQDARAAFRASRLLSQVAKSSGEALDRARALWVRGHCLGELMRHAEAIECYEQAADIYRQHGQPREAARVAVGQVNVLRYLGQYRRALDLGERARAQLARHADPLAAVRLDCNLATLHHWLEHRTEALAMYDRALRTCRRAGDDAMERVVRYNRARLLAQLGRVDQARAAYESLRHGAAASGERRTLATIEAHLGYVALQRGEYSAAFAHLDEARTALEELDDPYYLLQTTLDLASMLLEVNAYVRAAALAQRAAEQACAAGLRGEEGHAAFLLGVAALGQDDLEGAVSSLQRARKLYGRRYPISRGRCSLYLAHVHWKRGKPAQAVRLLHGALRIFEDQRATQLQATAWLRLGQVERSRGRLTEASHALQQARRASRSLPSRWIRAQLAHLAGGVAAARENRASALRHYRRALRHVEALRHRVGFDELRAGFSQDKAPLYADTLTTLLERGRKRDVAEAFAVAEQSRARALLDGLGARLSHGKAGASASSRKLLDRIENVRAQINTVSGLGSGGEISERPVAAWARARTLVRGHEEELADLYQRLARRDPRALALSGMGTTSMQQVQATLPPDVTLVEYFLDGDSPVAFILTRRNVRVVQLTVDGAALREAQASIAFQLEKRTYGREYVDARAGALLKQLDRPLETVAQAIWRPLELDAGTVIVVPHGPLHACPFYCLPLTDGERVIDRHVLAQLPSASVRTVLPSGAGVPARSLVVGIDAPDVPQVGGEVKQVARLLPGSTVLRNRRASVDRFGEHAATADVIHVATHGVFRQDDPAFSSLLLGDRWMDLHEITRLGLNAPLVTLSTCQSGAARIDRGDELIGLARGFFSAGARALVASQWSVDDEAAAALMSHFYRSLTAGARPELALRQAMLELRAHQPDPFYWAPFVYMGDVAPDSDRAGIFSRPSPSVS